MKLTAIVIAVSLVTPSLAYADTDVPLAQGQAAPFTGVLLTPEAYGQTVKEKSELLKLRVTSASLDSLVKSNSEQYQAELALKQKEADYWKHKADRSWWEQNQLQVGIGVGVAATLLVTLAVVQVLSR